MGTAAYISINILLFFSWYALLFRKRDAMRFADRLLGVFVLGLTQIIATEMVLGVIFRSLFAVQLFALNAIVSGAVLAAALKGADLKSLFREAGAEAGKLFRTTARDPLLLCLCTLFSLLLARILLFGYLFPSYTWDALYYHMPMVGQILQSGAIQENPTPSFIQQYINIFGKNVNLFFLWNVIFLKDDVIVDLSQLCFNIAGILAVYGIAVKIRIREKYAVYASLLFFFTPVIILQSTANYVDSAVSMLLLVSMNFLVPDKTGPLREGAGESRRLPLLLSGLSAGILLGSKPTGPLFIAVIVAAVLGRELIKYRTAPHHSMGRERTSLKKDLQIHLVFFIVPVLFAGGYWYFRNWILHGNPVYYMDVSIFNITLFRGLESGWVEPAPAVIEQLNYLSRLVYVWLEKVGYYMYDSRLSGFGPVWFILFLPAVIFALAAAIIKRNYSFLFVFLIFLVTFIIHPRNWTTRYVIFITGLGALSFGIVMESFQKRDVLLRTAALLLAGYTFLTVNSPCVAPGKIREFLSLPAGERTLTKLKPFNIDVKVRDEYGIWIWIENNIQSGDTLAYTFEKMTLDTDAPFFLEPLWNSGFTSRVVYVKADSYREWLGRLQKNDATYILIRRGSVEDRWVEKERSVYYTLRWMGNVTEKFRVEYEDDTYRILKFSGGGDA